MKGRLSVVSIAALAVVVVLCLVYARRKNRVELCENSSSIFVSIASYRDQLCKATVESMYKNALHPARVFAGVYEQNAESSESCRVASNGAAAPYARNVRTVTVDASRASGPCTARYQCALLMRDEPVFLQIDSHTEFARGWDVAAVRMLRSLHGAQDGKVVISTYPINCGDGWEAGDPPVIDKAKYGGAWITFQATLRPDARGRHVPSRQIGGGFLLCVADVIRAVPFDPGLAGLFNQEELGYTARLYTHGIDVVAPRRNLVCHRYTYGEHKTVWADRPDWAAGAPGPPRVDALLSGTHPELYGPYGMGAARPLSDFWEHVGVEYNTKTIREWPH